LEWAWELVSPSGLELVWGWKSVSVSVSVSVSELVSLWDVVSASVPALPLKPACNSKSRL
jgi:hypothetical protein